MQDELFLKDFEQLKTWHRIASQLWQISRFQPWEKAKRCEKLRTRSACIYIYIYISSSTVNYQVNKFDHIHISSKLPALKKIPVAPLVNGVWDEDEVTGTDRRISRVCFSRWEKGRKLDARLEFPLFKNNR